MRAVYGTKVFNKYIIAHIIKDGALFYTFERFLFRVYCSVMPVTAQEN